MVAVIRRSSKPDTCTLQCNEPYYAKGWCVLHYSRYRRTGDPTTTPKSQGPNAPTGDKSVRWVGDDVGYAGAHYRIYTVKGKASDHSCTSCGNQAKHWAYNHAALDERQSDVGPYSLDPNDYMAMCRLCHNRFDAEITMIKRNSI